MYLIRGLHNLNKKQLPARLSITIGNYDGIHLGHQKILSALQKQAAQEHTAAMAIIFEPQPREFFAKEHVHRRLMNLREKLAGFAKYGIKYVLCLRFNEKLLNLTPEYFVKHVLLDRLNMHDLVVGEDFAFGNNRSGGIDLIKEYAKKYNFNLIAIPQVIIDNQRISSTLIRNALITGNLELAKKFLGKNYSICGRVIHGDKRGRKLEFPTANIHLHYKTVPLAGVYAIRAYGINATPLYGIANVGFRPTVGSTNRRLLEIYLFDFNADIYGKFIRVEFLKHIRDEKKFQSLEELKAQIASDVAAVKKYFKNA
jgi:riboflavin kinase / FMN adenylyltransferase